MDRGLSSQRILAAGVAVATILLMKPMPGIAGTDSHTRQGARQSAERFTSLHCKEGDITLGLRSDHTFVLDIQYWDQKNYKVSRADTLSGTWKKNGKNLELRADRGPILHYALTTSTMRFGTHEIEARSYGFKGSSSKCFATGYDLVDEAESDIFFRQSIQQIDSTKR